MRYPQLTVTKIYLRNTGWTWNRKLRRWEHTGRGESARQIDGALRLQREWENQQFQTELEVAEP